MPKIQLRRDTAAGWTSANPVLASGEAGFESDTGQVKVGNNSAAWTALSYFGGGDLYDADTDTFMSPSYPTEETTNGAP